MNRFLAALALPLLAATGAAAQTNVNWGLQTGANPRSLCVYDATHVCVTTGALDSVAHTFTATLSPPGPSTLGGVFSATAPANQFMRGIDTTGTPLFAQPNVTNLAGFGTGVATALAASLNATGGLVGYSGALGTPTSGTLTNATGLPISTGVSGLGTGVATALAASLNATGGLVGYSGALGTPTSGTLTNATGLPISTGVSGLGTGVATALAASLNATGGLVGYSGALGTPTSGTLTNATGLPAATGIANGALPAGVTINNGNWSGTGLALTNIGTIAANTVIGNPTASTAAPTVTSDMVGFRNRIINGNDALDQRNAGASQTITAGAALAYTDDRFYVYSTGAGVTGQQVNRGNATQKQYTLTGAASTTAINRCQRIESYNSADLAGSNATFSVDLSDSLLTTVNWQIWYANTQDTFGTVASPTVTSISSGSFTVTSSITRYSTTVAIPSAAVTGLQVCLSVGAQTSGTFVTSNWQVELGSYATAFERRPIGVELALCQRYFHKSYAQGMAPGTAQTAGLGGYYSFVSPASNGTIGAQLVFSPTMRAAPTITTYDNAGTPGKVSGWSSGWASGLSYSQNATTDNGFSIYLPGSYQGLSFDYTASAEL